MLGVFEHGAKYLQNRDDSVLFRKTYNAEPPNVVCHEYDQKELLYQDKQYFDDGLEENAPVQRDSRSARLDSTRVIAFLCCAIALLLVVGAGLSDYIRYSPLSSKPKIEGAESSGAAFQSDVPTLNAHLTSTMTVATTTSTSAPVLQSSSAVKPTATSVQDKYLLRPGWNVNAVPTRREYSWTIQDTEYNPDGVYRPMMLINNEYPGPLIEANEGDTIVVHVSNKATNATSFHWHGIYQNGTNWMDGTVGITQCPIAPGARFTYEFTLDNQSGTYWYHAHQAVQSSDGLYGPLIIHSKDEETLQGLEYASDRIVMLSDFYHDSSNHLLMSYLASDAENAEPVPDSAVINGQAIRDCSEFPLRKCDNTTSNVGTPTFNFETGKNHRLRILNVGAFAEFQLSLDQNTFAITEVDGTNVLPVHHHRLLIQPAQRYSIIISNNGGASDERSYWLRAKMLTHCFAEPNPALKAETWAVVNFVPPGSSVSNNVPSLPTSTDWPEPIQLECVDMDFADLVPVPAIAAPQEVDATFHIRLNFEIGAWRLSRAFFNSSSFRPNVTSPTLHRAIEGLNSMYADVVDAWSSSNASTTNGASTDSTVSAFVNTAAFSTSREFVVQTKGVQVVDFIVTNYDDGSHFLHLHGYKFFVLAQGHGRAPSSLSDVEGGLDISNPLRRDTASIAAFSWLAIRVIADNPGLWAFHCHAGWHTEAGLVMQMFTRSEVVQEWEIPTENRGLCKANSADLVKGMAPEDEEFMQEDAEDELNN